MFETSFPVLIFFKFFLSLFFSFFSLRYKMPICVMMSASPAVGGPNLNVGIFLAAVWARVCILCIIISCRSKPGRRVNPCAHTVMQVFRLVWISYFQTFQVRVSFCILQEVVLRTGFWATGPFMLGVEPVTTAEPFSLFFSSLFSSSSSSSSSSSFSSGSVQCLWTLSPQ